MKSSYFQCSYLLCSHGGEKNAGALHLSMSVIEFCSKDVFVSTRAVKRTEQMHVY